MAASLEMEAQDCKIHTARLKTEGLLMNSRLKAAGPLNARCKMQAAGGCRQCVGPFTKYVSICATGRQCGGSFADGAIRRTCVTVD